MDIEEFDPLAELPDLGSNKRTRYDISQFQKSPSVPNMSSSVYDSSPKRGTASTDLPNVIITSNLEEFTYQTLRDEGGSPTGITPSPTHNLKDRRLSEVCNLVNLSGLNLSKVDSETYERFVSDIIDGPLKEADEDELLVINKDKDTVLS